MSMQAVPKTRGRASQKKRTVSPEVQVLLNKRSPTFDGRLPRVIIDSCDRILSAKTEEAQVEAYERAVEEVRKHQHMPDFRLMLQKVAGHRNHLGRQVLPYDYQLANLIAHAAALPKPAEFLADMRQRVSSVFDLVAAVRALQRRYQCEGEQYQDEY